MLIFLLELRSRHRQWRFSSSCRRCTESHEEWRRCERHRSSLKIGDAVKDSYSYPSFVKPTLTAGCLCRISTGINLVLTISTKSCLLTKTDLYTSNKDAKEDSNPDIPAKVLIMSLELGLAGPAIQVIHTWFKSLCTNHGFSHNMNVCFKMLLSFLHSPLPNLDFQAGLSQAAQAVAFNVVERQNSKQQVLKVFLCCCCWFEAILIFSASSFLCILLQFYWHLLLAFRRGILS